MVECQPASPSLSVKSSQFNQHIHTALDPAFLTSDQADLPLSNSLWAGLCAIP